MLQPGFATHRCAVNPTILGESSAIRKQSNFDGDRCENVDYQYGKRRLRQIDGRIRFLTQRIEAAGVVDPEGSRAGQPPRGRLIVPGASLRLPSTSDTARRPHD